MLPKIGLRSAGLAVGEEARLGAVQLPRCDRPAGYIIRGRHEYRACVQTRIILVSLSSSAAQRQSLHNLAVIIIELRYRARGECPSR